MKKDMIRKLLALAAMIGLMVILTGCRSTKVKCVKSHEEKTTCIRYYNLYQNGRVTMQPQYYICEKTVCDQYERVVDEK